MKTWLLVIATAAVVLIASMMAKDRWDLYQYRQALKKQKTIADMHEWCAPPKLEDSESTRYVRQEMCKVLRQEVADFTEKPYTAPQPLRSPIPRPGGD
jgi:hypothetical protein